MEFQKIGKNTVQCHMTMDEMSEYGLGVDDLFNNGDKSRDFIELLVERAEEEVGYEMGGGMLSLQLMKLPDDSLIITFSDRGDDTIQGMLNHIQNLVGMIDEGAVDTVAEDEAGVSDEGISVSDFIQDLQDKVDQQSGVSEKTQSGSSETGRKKSQDTARLFCFPSLDAVEELVSGLYLEKSVPSRLYKDETKGNWYLFMKKGKLRLEEYQKLCQRITEFAGSICSRPFAEQYCKEHFRLVIGKQALKTLKEYVG